MSQKSILITGCSSGIGHDAALELHARGWRVFATCRKETDCARLRELGLESFHLDYDDSKSIQAAVQKVLSATGGTLDALYNNGAWALPGFAADYTRDGLRAIFETNFFGQVELMNAVLPVMEKQGHGHIVNCSSVLGLVAMRGRGAYNSTKFALEGLTDTLRRELRASGSPVKLVLLTPGPIGTKIRENAQAPFERFIDWKNSPRRAIYEQQVIPRLYAENPPPDPGQLPASACTAKLIRALETTNPKPRYSVTRPTYVADFLRRILPVRMLDAIMSRM